MSYLSDLRMDGGYAARLLRRAPGFALIAVVTLALGIGAATAIFTVVDAVLLRPLRFAEPHQLVAIRPTSGSRVSAGYFTDWRLESRAFDDMAAWYDAPSNLTGSGAPLEVLTDRVTPNFFSVLGVPAALGRTFAADEDLRRTDPEVVLSHGLWQRRFGGDPGLVGRVITLDGRSLTIVGVMPPGFSVRTTELAQSRTELWVPLGLEPGDRTGMGGILHVVGRLRPEATPPQGQTDLAAIARRIEAAYPSYSHAWGVEVVPLLDATVGNVRLVLLVVFGAVGMLLAIACANVANLVLIRAASRRAELAIRFSLGAGRARLAQQLLTEGLVLSIAGGALGVVLAVWGTQLLVGMLPAGFDLPRTMEIGLDARVFAFSGLLVIGTSIVFGLAPVLGAVRGTSTGSLRETSRGSSAGPRHQWVAGALVVSEVALALLVLSGAGLLLRSVVSLNDVDPGFRSDQVVTMRMTLPEARYDTDNEVRVFGRELLTRVASLPGVRSAGHVSYLPMSRVANAMEFTIDGRPRNRNEHSFALVTAVGGRYFDVMGIPLRQGRLPGDADSERTQPVFVVDEEMARRFWPEGSPIGARLTWGLGDEESLSGEIVGVVGSVRWGGLADRLRPSAYLWYPQMPERRLTVVARTSGDPDALARAMAAQVAAIDTSLPAGAIRLMRDVVGDDLAQPRFTTTLVGGFALAALLLAAIGLHGVMSASVAQRTREIGVRVALGAQRADVLRLIMRRGLVLVAAGLALGLAGMLALGRFVASLLFGVTATDPLAIGGTAGFLVAVAALAMYLPARRAALADPIAALRAE